MKKIIPQVLHIIRYLICTPFVLLFGLITSPLSLIFGWKGYYILWIANENNCSLDQARKILVKGNKYRIKSNALIIVGACNCKSALDDQIKRSREFDERYTMAYKYLPINIYHNHFPDSNDW